MIKFALSDDTIRRALEKSEDKIIEGIRKGDKKETTKRARQREVFSNELDNMGRKRIGENQKKLDNDIKEINDNFKKRLENLNKDHANKMKEIDDKHATKMKELEIDKEKWKTIPKKAKMGLGAAAAILGTAFLIDSFSKRKKDK